MSKRGKQNKGGAPRETFWCGPEVYARGEGGQKRELIPLLGVGCSEAQREASEGRGRR